MKHFLIFLSAVLLSGLALYGQADAAVLSAISEIRTVSPGREFSVDIKIDSENVSINAVQATVKFPLDILELIDADIADSVFDFWLEGPLVSNEDGTLKFIAGTNKGVSGSSLHVLKMKFKSVGSGPAEIAINDSVVTAADGRGTNVLSRIEAASIAVNPEVVSPEAPAVAPPAPQQPQVEQPQEVVRPPIEAAGLPEQPKLLVPLYPDESRWYNHLGEVVIFWEVPEDVIRVATALDQNPGTSPNNVEKELFTGKSFGRLSDGVWYAHVQFRNNVGWGPEAHYKISIDTVPPVPFEAGIDGGVSDNPAPKISFETYDSISGISHALIYVDNQEPIESKETSLVLPLQGPGKKTLKVRFFDLAGNSVEDDLEFEILPLPTPIILFVTKQFEQGDHLFATGVNSPDNFIDLLIYDESGRQIDSETAVADSLGKWEISTGEHFSAGRYKISAVARDERGALSYTSESQEFRVRPRVVLSAGPVDLGWFEIILLAFLLAASGVGFYGWYYWGVKRKREAYAIVVARDVEKMHDMLEENLKKLENNIKNLDKFVSPLTKDIDPTMKAESLVFIKKMAEVLDKIKKYVKREVEELK